MQDPPQTGPQVEETLEDPAGRCPRPRLRAARRGREPGPAQPGDLASEFAAAGAQRLGISADPVAKQKRFSEQNGFDYPLLSDESGDVATSYGVRRRLLTPVKRATFVIARDRTVAEVITSELNMDVHADRALAALNAL